MKRAVINSLGLVALLTFALGISSAPAHATNIGVLAVGSSFSDTIQSSGPSFSQDYDFTLNSSAHGITILATSLGQTSADFGVDMLDIALYDSSHNLIASASGTPIASFDSFAQSGLALGPGAYLFTVLGDVTAGKDAFVSISLAANNVVAQTPIPAAGLLLLTGMGALGGAAWRRRSSVTRGSSVAAA